MEHPYFCLPRSGQAYELLTLRRLAVMLAVMQPFLHLRSTKQSLLSIRHFRFAKIETLSPKFPFAECGRPPREFLLLFFQLTQHLFQDANDTSANVGNFGMDLMALNLQRGRDHGIPPYHEYRKLCGLPAIRNWRQLSQIVAAPEVRVTCIVIARIPKDKIRIYGIHVNSVQSILEQPDGHEV